MLSAGNEAVNAAPVSPAGAAWGYTQPGAPPVNVRFWNGAPPPGTVLYRAVPEFTVCGGCHLLGGVPALWPLTNTNAGAVAAVDGFAPAAGIPCATAAGVFAVGSGTSYSAGFAAAMLTWTAWQRPWATPAQARTWLNNSMTPQPGGWMKLETPALPAAGLTWQEWIDAFYPAATSTAPQRDPAGDPDSDGVKNFVEYFAGGDPRFPDPGIEPEVQITPGSTSTVLTLKMPIASHLPPAPRVTWVLEESASLTTWTTVPTGPLTKSTPLTIHGDAALHQTTAAVPNTTRRMVRVRFTCTP